jgi:hypothetical protein
MVNYRVKGDPEFCIPGNRKEDWKFMNGWDEADWTANMEEC